MTDRQQTADSQFYSLGLATGEVMTSHNLPGYDPGVAALQLEYSSLAANPLPIFLTHFTIDPSQAVPATVSAKLTFNSVAGSTFYYNTSQLNPGDIMEIASQGDATGLSTGRYSYSVAVTANYGTPVTTTYSGSVNIVNSAASPFGAGWSLAGYERVWAVTGGILLELPGGLSLWFAGSGPSYTTPAGDFSTLVKNGDNTYTRTMKDGTKYNFSTTGLQTSFVDRNGNTTTYGYDGSNRLNAITDLNSLTTTLAYNASNKVTSFTDPTSKVTTLGYDVSNTRLTSVTDPDNALWGYGYDTSTNRLTGLTDPRNNTTTFAYNFAGRVSTVTRPDLTTEGLTALQMSGLVQSGQGTQGNPAASTLAAQAQATYTDPRSNHWLTDFDWLGFGTASQQSDPLANMMLTYPDANAEGWLTSDPLGRRTRFLFDTKANPTEIVYADDTHQQYAYNSFSEPTQFTDPGNNVTTYGYDSNGNLTAITQPNPGSGSPITTFGYNTKGFLTTTTDPDNHTTTFGYDTRDRMTSRTDALTHVATYGYDSASNQTSVTDERSNVTTYSFDNMHRMTGMTLPDSNPNNHPAYTYTLDADGNVTGVTDPLNHTTTYTFDKLNRLTGITDALSHTTTQSYDNAGNRTGVTDALSHTTTYTFDAADRLTGVTDSLSHTTTYGYDAASQLSSMEDALLRTTTYSYTARGWQSGIFDPTGNSTTYAFNSAGDRIGSTAVAAQFGQQGPSQSENTTYTYDALHRAIQKTDALGHALTYAFDSVGNLMSVTGADGDGCGCGSEVTASYSYDADNREITRSDGLNHTTTFGYDNVGNQTTVTDPLNRTTTSAYDPRNRLTSVTDARNGVTSYVYDFASRLTSITDSVNNTTTYGYDNANRLTSVTDSNNHATTYGYDNANRLTGITDRDGRTRTFTYDNANRKTNETWVGGSYTATYTHDAANNLTGESDAFSAYTYTYDKVNRLTGVDNNGTPSAPHLVLSYTHDGFNNVLSVSDNLNGSIAYSYNGDNQLTSASMTVSTTQGPQVTLGYDTRNRRSGITRSVSGTPSITSTYTYDDANRLTNLSYTSSQAGALASYTYSYDLANQVTGYIGPDGTLTYTYDNNGQLTGVSGAHAETYTYDTNGNRTMTGYSTSTGNRLTNDGTYSYTYDTEGNMLTKTRISDGQVTSFTWDYRNRLTEVTVKTSGGSTLQDDKFTYDVENRRIGKNTLSGGQTWTAYDGANPYADFNTGGSLTYRYLYGRALDFLLSRWDGTNALWYLTDKLGSVRQDVTTSGSVSDQIVYDSYGNIISETSPSSGDRFKFTGREWDSEIALYFYRARYVSPSDGRFESEDPLGFGGGDTDLYRYVDNHPTNAIDPTGRKADKVGKTLELIEKALTPVENPAATVLGCGGKKTIELIATFEMPSEGKVKVRAEAGVAKSWTVFGCFTGRNRPVWRDDTLDLTDEVLKGKPGKTYTVKYSFTVKCTESGLEGSEDRISKGQGDFDVYLRITVRAVDHPYSLIVFEDSGDVKVSCNCK